MLNTTRLRELLVQRDLLVAPGAYDALSASAQQPAYLGSRMSAYSL